VGYACEACGAISSEMDWKLKGLKLGQWRPTAMGEPGVRSYHLPSFYAPLGWRPWADLAVEFFHAGKDPVKLKKIVNNEWAECWQEQTGTLDEERIEKRALGYLLRTIPRGCLLLTMAVDVQGDRLEYQILGFGRGKKHWVIDYGVLMGNPARQAVWDDLTALRARPIENEYGISMRPLTCGIDSGGHHTHEVYAYCRKYQHEMVFALKGAKERRVAIIGSQPSKQDIDIDGRTVKSGIQLWKIGTDTAKEMLFGYLAQDDLNNLDEHFIHFPAGLGREYYRQLTAEKYDETRQIYVKLNGRRNEVIDLFVYCFAAAYHPRVCVDKMRESDWAHLEQIYEPRNRDLFADPLLEPTNQIDPDPKSATTQSAQPQPLPTPSPIQEPAPALAEQGGWLDGYGDGWLN
jgi:phage terminase large subunit GpA-like protein